MCNDERPGDRERQGPMNCPAGLRAAKSIHYPAKWRDGKLPRKETKTMTYWISHLATTVPRSAFYHSEPACVPLFKNIQCYCITDGFSKKHLTVARSMVELCFIRPAEFMSLWNNISFGSTLGPISEVPLSDGPFSFSNKIREGGLI